MSKDRTPNQSFWDLNCEEATRLISKKRDTSSIGFFNWLKLRTHLRICDLCKRFQDLISLTDHIHDEKFQPMPEDMKERIRNKLIP